MTGDLFSDGFQWDGVAPAATRPATRPIDAETTSTAAMSHTAATPVATLDAPSFSGGFAWGTSGVASVASVADDWRGGDLSQECRLVTATPDATPKTGDFGGARLPISPAVANGATFANWAAGVERMARGYCPEGRRDAEWRQMLMDARQTLQNWGSDFVALGWSTLDLFGVNRSPRAQRVDIPGLVYFLGGRPIEAIDRDTATIRSNARDCSTFNRKLIAPGGIPIWDWAARAPTMPVGGMDRGEGVAPSARTPALPPLSTGVVGWAIDTEDLRGVVAR